MVHAITQVSARKTFLTVGQMSDMAIFRQLSGRMKLVGQDAQGECCRREYQNEGGGSNAFEIADTQMRHHRAHKVEDEADARRHTE